MYVAILVILSSILTVVGVIPYIVEVVRRHTKPRVVSWFTWSVLTAIACIAAIVEKQYPTAILLFFATIETLLVVILGWRYGDKKIERLDVIFLVGALVGIGLWQVFNSPAVGVIAVVIIDFLGGVPTFIHAWEKPHEETAITFFLASLGALCTLLAVSDWRVTAVAYPLFLIAINLAYTLIIVTRGNIDKSYQKESRAV